MDQQVLSIQYSIGDKQCHAVCNLPNNKRHIFAVGSCCLKRPNEIHIIEFLEMEQKIVLLQVIQHPGMVHKIIPNGESIYVIYREVDNDQLITKLSCCQLNFNGQSNRAQFVFDIAYDDLCNVIPHENEPIIYLCSNKSISQFDLNKQAFTTLIENEDNLHLCEQDPYHPNLFARTNRNNLVIQDLREHTKPAISIQGHCLDILDIDFNPNKQYYLMSAGEDCIAKIWDIRKTQYAIKTLDDLHNSVLQAKYNRFHDQLVALSFDDGCISLYNLASVSSVPQITQVREDDYLMKQYDEHEDSIHSIAWSSATAWVFASVGFRGHVIVNTVPTAEKYKILL